MKNHEVPFDGGKISVAYQLWIIFKDLFLIFHTRDKTQIIRSNKYGARNGKILRNNCLYFRFRDWHVLKNNVWNERSVLVFPLLSYQASSLSIYEERLSIDNAWLYFNCHS